MKNFVATPRRWADSLLRSVGIQASRISPDTSDEVALAAMLRHAGVDLLLDVGANVGQDAQGRIACGYAGRIVSFEPLKGPREVLLRNAALHPNWEVAERCALGDHTGTVTIHIAEDSRASSVLPPTSIHLQNSPQAIEVASEVIPLLRLDDVARQFVEETRWPFLKIDVQRLEEQVRRGSTGILPKLVGLQVELSFVRMYYGQKLMPEMLAMITAMGFTLHRMIPAWIDVDTGQWLQADGVFFRL